jgi:alpha-L-fucosidase
MRINIINRVTIVSLFISIIISKNALAQKTGGGELNPGIFTNEKSLENFKNLRFGLSIHWGPNVIAEKEISWSRGKETPQAEYDALYKQFNPTNFNADEWVKFVQEVGMKYVIITSKHHDGFAMWHSEYSNYDVAITPFKRDILKELSDACQKKGVVFGTYYSTLDWYHPDYQPYDHGGPGEIFPKYKDTPNQSRYWIYAKNQVRELITKYNSQIIQFDGDWDSTWTHQIGSDMYLYIRKLNDGVLVNSRTDKGRYPPAPYSKHEPWRADIFAGDFEERERFTENFVEETNKVLGKSKNPWQAWVTVDKSQWSWKPSPKLLSSKDIIIDLLKTIGDDGNYLINIGPRPDGTFEPLIMSNMREVGTWVKAHAEAIYDTRGGNFVDEGKFTSTQKGKTTNLFVFDNSMEQLVLKNNKQKVVFIKNKKGQAIDYQRVDGDLILKIGKNNDAGFVRVYKVEFE